MSHCKYWLVVVCLLVLSGCDSGSISSPNRIRTVEWKHVGGNIVYIFEIDDVEYVAHSRGGIVKHER
jgi:hypothetical protein